MPTKYAAGAQLEYDVNPNYETISGGKEPGFKHLIFKYYPDNPDGMIAGFAQGEYDVAMNLNHSDVPKLTGMDKVLTEDTFTYEQLSFNNKRLAEKTGSGRGPGRQDRPSGLADRQDADRRPGPRRHGRADRHEQHLPAGVVLQGRRRRASTTPKRPRPTLEAAGWVPGTDGIREKAGKRLEFDFCTTTRPYRIDSLTAFAVAAGPDRDQGQSELPVPGPSLDLSAAGPVKASRRTPCAT